MLEGIMGVAQRTHGARALPGPKDPALRKARVCYDHLAGELAVSAYDAFVERGFMRPGIDADCGDSLALTQKGSHFFVSIGIDVGLFGTSRRPVCRPCLDWSVRRHHLAGSLGKALLEYCYRRRWAKRVVGSRIVKFSRAGEHSFHKTLSLRGEPRHGVCDQAGN